MVTDPVCGKEIDEKAPAGGKVHYWDKVFYFCTEECRKAFRRSPQKYAPETAEEKTPGSTYKKRPDDWFA
jgi:YHS domain-containing protein